MTVAVLQFPGSNCEWDTVHALRDILGIPARLVWHKETQLHGFDAAILPGGFSFGDYLRCGAIARFSPILKAVVSFAKQGGCVLGICNGFQILCEAGLLPGVLIRNHCLEFRCLTQVLAVEAATVYFNPRCLGEQLRLPIAHGAGNYYIDPAGLEQLEAHHQILLRYADASGHPGLIGNPNGSVAHIAAVRNRAGNVMGMMPHPERAVEWFHPSQDGMAVLRACLGV